VARTPLPARHTWRDEPTDSPIGRRIALIRELEQLGAAVHVLTVDVGDAAALRAVLHEFIDEGWPAIRGVHHTAAVFGGQFMTDLTEADLIAQLRPKLVGAWTLADELPELDHLVLYSSIAALLPMAGQGAYAAGNAFLDVFAAYRRDLGKPALSVDWAFWEGSSDEESNAREIAGYKDAARTLAEARGMHGFRPTLGLDALDRLLAHDVTSAAVLPIDWRAWAGARNTRPLALVADVVATATDAGAPNAVSRQATLAERLAAAPAAERADVCDGAVRRLVSEVLRLAESRIGDDQPFGTLGLDSLMAIELRNRLETETGLSLSATLAWNYPTVRDLRTYVLTRVGGGNDRDDDADASARTVGTSVPREADAVGSVGEVAAAVAKLSDEDALVTLLGEGT
jgi:myxalamid-type polyketide synthase MxaE and MxaD